MHNPTIKCGNKEVAFHRTEVIHFSGSESHELVSLHSLDCTIKSDFIVLYIVHSSEQPQLLVLQAGDSGMAGENETFCTIMSLRCRYLFTSLKIGFLTRTGNMRSSL